MNDRRTSVFILTGFQRWFIWNMVSYTLVLLTVLTGGIYLWFKVFAGEMMNLAGLLSPTLLDRMERSLRTGVWVIVALDCLLVGFSVFHAVTFSRKIAGPVFALVKHLDEVGDQGEWKRFKLRKNDLFGDLPEKLERAFGKTGKPRRKAS